MTTRNPLHLSDIPPEIIFTIGEECATRDVKSLRLVCKDFAVLLETQAVRDLSIHIKRHTLPLDICKLKLLARKYVLPTSGPEARMASFCAHSTRSLRIGSLLPIYSDVYSIDPSPGGLETEIAEYTVKELLFEVIASLQGLKVLKWKSPVHSYSENPQNHQIIMRAVKFLPKLCNLSIQINHHHKGLQLLRLTYLKDIQIINVDKHPPLGFDKGQNDGFLSTLNNLACLIASDSAAVRTHLRSLTVLSNRLPRTQDHFRMMLREGFWSFHHMLKYYPADEPPLNLAHLNLDGLSIRLDKITIPHLRNLTTLKLTNIVDPDFISVNTGEHNQDYRKQGSSPENFWRALQDAEIWLQEISLDVLTNSLMNYLYSYSGLRTFSFSNGNFALMTTSAVPDPYAHSLFDNGGALSTHLSCLERLTFTPRYLDGWTIKDGDTIKTILKCQNLQELNMSVHFGGRQESFWSRWLWATTPQYPQDPVTLLIETAVSMQLKVLGISVAMAEDLRGTAFGEAFKGCIFETTKWIKEIVKEYRGVRQLPALIINGHCDLDYVGTEDLETQTWRWQFKPY